MLKKSKNLKKDLKQVQKKGFNNPKTRFSVIFGVTLFTVVLCASYALYSYTESSLAFNSTINKRVKTTIESLKTKILSEEIKTNPKFLASHTDNGLYKDQDDQGETYYYRGNVTNNYLSFAGENWRIVRINGDGTIRIIKTDSIGESVYGNASTYKGSTAETKLNEWYNNNLKKYEDYIAETEYCNDITRTSWGRLHTATPSQSYVCPNETIKLRIGLITGDEMVYAGHISDANPPTYLSYLTPGRKAWTMTTSFSDTGVILGSLGYILTSNVAGLYPVINLKAGTQVTGEGTSSNPYEVVGVIEPEEKEGDYKVAQTFSVIPNDGYVYGRTSCTNGATATYAENNKMLTISNQTKDTTCTVTFDETLRHKILASNTLKTDYTDMFKTGYPSGNNPNDTSRSGLYKAEDDEGESYYFRGVIPNNYVSFANMLWRIVRINGDGTIRLIFEKSIGSTLSEDATLYKDVYNTYGDFSSVGYTWSDSLQPCTKSNPCKSTYEGTNKFTMNRNKYAIYNSTVKDNLEYWYHTYLRSVDSKIAYSTFCNDTTEFENGNGYINFSADNRFYNSNPTPTLKCPETKNDYGGYYQLKIGLLNVDEALYAGARGAGAGNYLTLDHQKFYEYWLMTPDVAVFSSSRGVQTDVFYIEIQNGGNLTISSDDDISIPNYINPVINLNDDVVYASGNGTSNSPYTIK